MANGGLQTLSIRWCFSRLQCIIQSNQDRLGYICVSSPLHCVFSCITLQIRISLLLGFLLKISFFSPVFHSSTAIAFASNLAVKNPRIVLIFSQELRIKLKTH